MKPFENEPLLELRRGPVRESLVDALHSLDAKLPLEVPVWTGDGKLLREDFESTDPGSPGRIVAIATRAGEAEAAGAVEEATRAGAGWGERTAAERAEVLLGAAEVLRARRLELAALEVRECAKPWLEADADVCEAIDYLEYYSRRAIELDAGLRLIQVPGERNTMRYAPLGVVAVIPPWNFPLAIPCGMAAAALATGNAVVLKPAEQSPGCGLALVEALREAGVPPAAISLLPGYGEAGAALVRDPRVGAIAFTGSSAVGLEIIREAAIVREGQHHVKRVIAEMGGKNCVIVDADADLDEAVPAIVRSAFAYAGQKCSAAARVIAHEEVAGALTERLAGAAAVLVVDQAERFGVDVPPVIEREAHDRIEGYARLGAEQGRVAARHAETPAAGWFVPPTLLTDLPDDSPLLREEIFGPVLTIEAAPSIDEACTRVEELPVALTAGLFSRSPETIDEVAHRLPAGNLYVNRQITGAMVGRQPFGGNRLSGIGSKAGGPDYLLQFVQPHVISENTTRHGLVIE